MRPFIHFEESLKKDNYWPVRVETLLSKNTEKPSAFDFFPAIFFPLKKLLQRTLSSICFRLEENVF